MIITGVIPARYASSRFPGKPLVMINGKSMIQRVYEQCLRSEVLNDLWVATDDERIESHVRKFGGCVMMTSTLHQSGTERCNEVYNNLCQSAITTPDILINIQGDEPFVDPGQINAVAACFKDPSVQIASLARIIRQTEELFNPHAVKVVRDVAGNALYFSRSPIPFFRGEPENTWINLYDYLKHIGIYGYRTDILRTIAKLPTGKLELAESLEQLRWMESGFSIRVALTENDSPSVDTPQDLEKLISSL